MSLLTAISTGEYERVSIFRDESTAVYGIIAVHDTSIGPALGGCRMRRYENLDDALFDVLRLAEGMTYKNALCGINFGGGKSVLVADPKLSENRAELFREFGRWVESFSGSYYAAEDMGTLVSDMTCVLESTRYVSGRDPAIGGGGDPSPYTAKGVFNGMRACLERVFGSGDFSNRHVAIQGVGKVGWALAELLSEAGAVLTVSDTREDILKKAAEEFSASVVGRDEIHSVQCDVFSPSAVGGIINGETVEKLACKIVAGAANNQLLEPEIETRMAERDILYAPDFAINSGGVILCADDIEPGGFSPSRVEERVARIYDTVGEVFDRASASGELPGKVAVGLAKERIEKARRARK